MGDRGSDEGRLDLPFVGIPSFLRAPVVTDLERVDADVVVVGAPFDEGSPFAPGSRFGPRSIREHSVRFVTGEPGYYDPASRRRFLVREMRDRRIVDAGDADVLPTNPAGTFRNITETVRAVLRQGAMPLVLGGDHSVTYPVVRAFDRPLHVMHFDAHLDYMPFVHGLEMTNQHAFRHIAHMDHVQSLTQVGIRSLRNTETMHRDSTNDGNAVLTMDDVRSQGPSGIAGRLPEGAACYVSLDIDTLDLPLVPGCVSAEPNGMQYAELRDILRALAERNLIVGFDVVEVNPQLDVGTGVTSYLAAHLAIEFLGAVCAGSRWRDAHSAEAPKDDG
ncbi:MAG TPA: arginase family protein [Actinomycetota bacterium]|nr:arginase family protein [Actinomycetota bacterium]